VHVDLADRADARRRTPIVFVSRDGRGQIDDIVRERSRWWVPKAIDRRIATALLDGVTFPFRAVGEIVNGLGALITGQVPGGVFGPQGFTGPIGIADVTAGAVSQGPSTYIFLVALLSVALGFTNLLPFLALDGGRVVVVLLEVLRRRPFDRASELNFQRIGLAALLAIAALISVLDIQRIASGQFPGFTH